MKRAQFKGRMVEPVNFSKEICFSFNALPFHILNAKFIPEIVSDLVARKSFFSKLLGGPFCYRLKLKTGSTGLSSSLYNFRRQEEEKCRYPVEFFL